MAHTSAQQHEEAWFLGLRLNAGVSVATLQREFGAEMVEGRALQVVARLAKDGLLISDGKTGSADCARTAAVEQCISGVSGAGGAC